MEVTWIGCHYGNEPHVKIEPVGVFIHWIVGTQASCDATFNREGRYASTTYSIAGDQVHQYVEEGYATWHCGASQNYTHMSIELEGWEGHPPTDETMQTCAELIAGMSKRWGWGKLVHTGSYDPECNVWEHNWVSATSCPGETDVDEIVRRANEILGYETEEVTMAQLEDWSTTPMIEGKRIMKGTTNTSPLNLWYWTEQNVEKLLTKMAELEAKIDALSNDNK